jgi:hypothetical protein
MIIACDELRASKRLCSELSECPAEIVCVSSLEALRRACESPCHLALIDVARSEMLKFIRSVRESPFGADCPVLVAGERFSGEPGPAGALPALRAMSCAHNELVRLARRLFTSDREDARPSYSTPL